MSAKEENVCDCGHTIPDDAPLGMCPVCLLGTGGDDLEEASIAEDAFGNFRVEEKLGEGGFAEVFAAEQLAPVRRRVALKMLRPEVATTQVLARFEAERQALALMDHPNIAAIFDAGESEAGRRWVSMEYVEGLPITEYAKKHSLSRNEKLRLFLSVCRAVQHAHLKGVIHRDLKPSNILVAKVDGVAVPKVIDFGIARAIDASLTDSTLYTEMYQLVGTPGYMSPEQASFDAAAIDGRSDIYSLGVILYEMLCGTAPFANQAQESPPVMELLRKVREEEFPKVSSHDPGLRGDVEAVILKTTEKDPQQRYDSAAALADEIGRLLDDRPVAAAVPTPLYHFRKFVRRHTVPFVAASIAIVALIVGGGIATVQFYRAVALTEDLRVKEIEARDAFRNSDFRLAGQLYERRRVGDAIAYLCRALRTDPNHHASASYLLSILTHSRFAKAKTAANPYPDEIESIRSPVLSGNGNSGVGIGRLQETGDEVLVRLEAESISIHDDDSGKPIRFLVPADREGRFALSDGTSLQLRDFAEPSVIAVDLLKDTEVTALISDPENGFIFAGSSSGEIRMWDSETGALQAVIEAAPSAISDISVGRDGNLLGFGTASGGVGFWNRSINLHRVVEGFHRSRVSKVLVSKSGLTISSGDEAGMVKVMRLPGLIETSGELPHGGEIIAMAQSARFRTLAVGDSEGFTRIWDIQTGKLASPSTGFQKSVKSLFTVASDDEFVSIGGCGTIRRINAETGFGEALPGAGATSAAALSGDRRSMVAFSDRRRSFQVFSLDRPSAIPFRDTGSTSIDPIKAEEGPFDVKMVNPYQLAVEKDGEVSSLPRTKQKILKFAADHENGRIAILTETHRLQLWSADTFEPLSAYLAISEDTASLQFTVEPTVLKLIGESGEGTNLLIPPPRPELPDWFLTFAGIFGGKEFSVDGDIVVTPESSLAAAKEAVPADVEKGLALDCARWLSDEQVERTLIPGGEVTVMEHVESLLAIGTPSAISEVFLFDPGNANAKLILKMRRP